MIVNPIIPIWLMAIICVGLIALKRKGMWPYIRQIALVIMLFVVNLRIMIPTDNVNTQSQKIDANILFVVDNTISMVAKDYGDNQERLKAVKEDCNHIIDELNGARFSVVTFANYAEQELPFNNNAEYVKEDISYMEPVDGYYAKGSSMNVSKDVMLKILEKNSEYSDFKTYVFFISDGEITNDDELISFEEIADYIDGGAVLGYGTEEGGKMYVYSYYGSEDKEVLRDKDGKVARSVIDEDNLMSIADDMGVEYIKMNEHDDADKIIEQIKKDASIKIDDDDESTEGYADIYFIFVIPVLLLLIYEFIDLKRNKTTA